MEKEKLLSRKIIYEGRIIRVRIDSVRTADGRRTTREIVEHEPCIAVVPVVGDDVLLIRQYRQATGKELLEIPAGGIEAGEDPAAAVVREMREETGLKPGKVERLTGFYLSPGFCNEYLHLFLAQDFTPAPLKAEDTAGIEVVRTPVKEIYDLIASGKIEDAKSIAGLLMYLHLKS